MTVPINYLAVVVAAIANYIIAYIWYSLIFQKTWLKLTGLKEMKPNAGTIILGIIGALLISYVLDHALIFASGYFKTAGWPMTSFAGGLMVGFFNWIGFFAPVTLYGVLYEKRPWKLWILDNAFWLISLLVMGVILAYWK